MVEATGRVEATGSTIRFRCPSCRAWITTEAAHGGRRAKCVDCGALLTVPRAVERVEPMASTAPRSNGSPDGSEAVVAAAVERFGGRLMELAQAQAQSKGNGRVDPDIRITRPIPIRLGIMDGFNFGIGVWLAMLLLSALSWMLLAILGIGILSRF